MRIETYEAKSIVRKEKNSENIYLNPYQGCYHDCVYCDGKAENYHMHEDFGTRIRVKTNAPELLEKHLKKAGYIPVNREQTGTLMDYGGPKPEQREKFTIGISGGVCDIYQPAEEVVGISRKVMQVVYDFDFPLFLLTKNKLVLKDLDLLKKINDSTKATVAMSVAFADDGLCRIFEPNASSTQERFAVLKVLHDEGINTGIWAMPLLPWIGDTDENMGAIFAQSEEVGVDWMCWAGLTLKPGRQKEQFMRTIGQHFPELLPKYQKLYGNDNKWGILDINVARELGLKNPMEKGKAYAKKYDIEDKGWYGEG
jgi:DNA repair photolyase